MKNLPIIIFLTVFLAVYFGMHYYTLYRVLGFFSGSQKIWIAALLLSATYPIAALMDRLLHSLASRITYYIASAWLGIVFLTMMTLLILEIANLITPIFKLPIVGYGLIIFILAISTYAMINASQITVKEVSIDNGKEMKVVQLSDVHIGTIRNSKFLNRIVDKTNELKPDIVFITGDLVDGSGKLSQETFAPLNNISAPVYYIMGNHEFYEGEDSVAHLLNKSHAKVLRNSMAVEKGVNIIGLDYSEKTEYVAEQLSRINFSKSRPTIILNHVPIGYEEAKKSGAKLQLSGHTHNGQLFPFTLFVKLRFAKTTGLYKMGNFSFYISQGTGTWGPPMRLGSKSEITLLNLK